MEKYEKKYKEALEKARQLCDYSTTKPFISDLQDIFPELKDRKESEDENIRKEIVSAINIYCSEYHRGTKVRNDMLAWLNTNETISRDEFTRSVLRGAAISLITWIDYNTAEGNMCLSNMECKDIEDALVNCDWDKIYAYIKKKLEKQGESKSYSLKPTREQFEALDYAYNSCPDTERGSYYKCVLETLIEDLHRLEKQGEQKPVDKIEPKFHKGDWIVPRGTEYFYQVVAVIDNQYQLKYGDTYILQKCAEVDMLARLWDITKDAKDGDILSTEKGRPLIFRGLTDKDNPDRPVAYCGIDRLDSFYDSREWNNSAFTTDKVFPATKEQCSLLFQKMKKAGYEWDSDKKELKKIEQKPAENSAKVSESSTEEKDMGEYKKGFECGKQRVLKYPEDFGLCKKSAWSEEDEVNLNEALSYIKDDALKEFIKSLRHQSTWKPTEEQMDALDYYANSLCTYCDRQDDLRSLFNVLKKL